MAHYHAGWLRESRTFERRFAAGRRFRSRMSVDCGAPANDPRFGIAIGTAAF